MHGCVLFILCRFQILKIPQVGQPNMRSVHFRARIFLLSPDGGRDFPVQLASHALCPEQADLL